MGDRVIVVTGGHGVLGRAVVEAALADGVKVALIDHAAGQGAPDGAFELDGVDLTDAAAADSAIAAVVERYGRLDALLNIAGGFVWQMTDDPQPAWDRMFALNLTTALNASRAALPHLKASTDGRIVNVGSAAALKSGAGMGAYAASKSAVHRLTESLAEELKATSVTVNAVLPSVIDTPANRTDMPDVDPAIWVAPADLAAVILFLASPASRAMTGALAPGHRTGLMAARPIRSVLYLPASNARAIAKARTLPCDVAVLDLEDAVAPEAKADARAAAAEAVRAGGFGPRLGVRINGLDTEWGADDLAALAGTGLALFVAPKVESAEGVRALTDRLPAGAALWAMIETPAALMRLESIAGADGALAGLMLGVNDLAATLNTGASPDREPLKPWLAATVAAARMHGLAAVDGVFNRIEDAAAFEAECAQGRLHGFDGKSLIHPSQIAGANTAFAPSAEEIARARAVVAAFAAPEAEGRGAIRLNGAMVERLHLAAAEALLERAAACGIT